MLKQDTTYIIRLMEERDIPQAIEIDRQAFPTQWPHPTYASFKQELRNRLARYIVVSEINYQKPKVTMQDNSKGIWQKLSQIKHLFDHDRFFGEEIAPSSIEYVVGITGFWIMVDEAHITTIAVRDSCQRQGIGEWLLIALIDMSIQLNAHIVTLEVRVSNKQAQGLYEKYGFKQVGLRRKYYSDNGEDALLMSTETLTSAPFQLRFKKLKQVHECKLGKIHYNQLIPDSAQRVD